MASPRRDLFLVITTAALLLLAACAPRVGTEQPRMTFTLPLESGKSLGQTFMARYDGLQGIAIYLRPELPVDGRLTLTLSDSPLGGRTISQTSLPLEKIDRKGYQRFNFPAVEKSSRQDYYLSLDVQGDGLTRASVGPGESYLYGAAYRNGAPEDAQLAFRLVYEPRRLVMGLAGEAVSWLGLLAAGFFLYILPGWGLLRLLYPAWSDRRWPEKIGLAAGLSLAIYPLLYLWTDRVSIHLGSLYAWLPPLAAAAYLGWVNLLKPGSYKTTRAALKQSLTDFDPSDLAYVLLALILFAARFWAVRLLDVPMWGDSYHHALVVQLLGDHGGLFDSWAPYAELQTFTYHFGFHTLAASLQTVSDLTATHATLWTGQLVNGLAALCLYPLAVKLGRNRWAGVAAVLVAGLLAPMPMGYVNWGRFTQLAGQVILAGAVYLMWETLSSEKRSYRLLILTGLVLAGLALTHLRVLIFAALFLPAYLIFYLRKDRIRTVLGRTLAFILIAAFLYLPWLIHTSSGQIISIFSNQITTPASQVLTGDDQVTTIGNLFDYLPAVVWLFLPVVVGWGLWRRERAFAVVSIWWWLVLIAGEPGWFGLPGSGAISMFAVLIAAYFPAALFYGAAAGWGAEILLTASQGGTVSAAAPRAERRWLAWGILLAALAAGLWGAWLRQADVQIGEHALALRPDLRAYRWIEENLPGDAHFLVNALLAFGKSTTSGTDGGWWLPLLAGRQITIPPMNYTFEDEPRPGYREWINALYKEIEAKGIADPAVLEMLRERRVSHVYIGQQQGSVSHFGVHNFDLDALQSSPDYRPVYHQDRVWIFEVMP